MKKRVLVVPGRPTADMFPKTVTGANSFKTIPGKHGPLSVKVRCQSCGQTFHTKPRECKDLDHAHRYLRHAERSKEAKRKRSKKKKSI